MRLKLCRLIGGNKAVDKRVKVPVYYALDIEILIVTAEAVIRHAVLREIIGADALAAVTRPDLTTPLTGDCRMLPRLL